MTRRKGPLAVMVALALAALCIGVLFYWSVAPTQVVEIKKVPIPSRIVRQGVDEIVLLKLDYCKKLSATGTIRVSFVSSSREIFLPEAQDRQATNCQKAEFPVLIPKDTPPDTYKIKFYTDYNVNPLHQHVLQQFESVPFKVGA